MRNRVKIVKQLEQDERELESIQQIIKEYGSEVITKNLMNKVEALQERITCAERYLNS